VQPPSHFSVYPARRRTRVGPRAGILPDMAWQDRIRIDPNVLAGKPVVGGTRLAVDFVIGLLGQGWSEDDILKNYPGLTREDIAACLQYAAETLNAEKVYPLTST
jgi:uncharacterized protein (DUF433 family)